MATLKQQQRDMEKGKGAVLVESYICNTCGLKTRDPNYFDSKKIVDGVHKYWKECIRCRDGNNNKLDRRHMKALKRDEEISRGYITCPGCKEEVKLSDYRQKTGPTGGYYRKCIKCENKSKTKY